MMESFSPIDLTNLTSNDLSSARTSNRNQTLIGLLLAVLVLFGIALLLSYLNNQNSKTKPTITQTPKNIETVPY